MLSGSLESFMQVVADAAERIMKWVKEGAYIHIFTHNDADALSSCGIIAGALRREDAAFKARSLPRIEEFFQLLDEGYVESEYILFTDMGSGYLPELKRRVGDREVVILDHHAPAEEALPYGWSHVNPHQHGFDGATEISASGVAYFVAKAMNEENISYSPIAIVGALGDLQDKDSKRSLRGLNSLIVDDAVKNGLLATYDDLILYGRNFRPVHLALASTTSPYIPGLSGQESACYNFLTSLGIPVKNGEQWRVLSDLTSEEKEKLFNGLIEYLVARNLPSSIANELVGTVYELVREDPWTYLRDGREFATLLNACGKTDNAWLGIAVAMGARGEVLEETQRVLENYRAQLARSIEYVTKPGVIEQMDNIVVLKGGEVINERQVSSVASILSSSGMLPRDKPLIAIADAGVAVKISARASRELVERGLDLGAILSKLAGEYGGRGGGHNVAAGADIPAERILRFLSDLDRIVGEALSAAG